MKYIACGTEINGSGKVLTKEGDTVCDEKCERKLVDLQNALSRMGKQDLEKWIDDDCPFSKLKQKR